MSVYLEVRREDDFSYRIYAVRGDAAVALHHFYRSLFVGGMSPRELRDMANTWARGLGRMLECEVRACADVVDHRRRYVTIPASFA